MSWNPLELAGWFRYIVEQLRRLEIGQRVLERGIMAIDDEVKAFADQTEANFASMKASFANIVGDIGGLNDTVKQLKEQLGNVGLSPNTKTLLQKLVDDSAALDTNAKAIDTSVPPVVVISAFPKTYVKLGSPDLIVNTLAEEASAIANGYTLQVPLRQRRG